MKSKASIKNIKLPDAPEPTRAVYKKPVIYYSPKHMRVVDLPCKYSPKPAPVPSKTKKFNPKATRCNKGGEGVYGRKAWPEERLQKLIGLYESGLPLDEIALELECSMNCASTMINKMRHAGRIKTHRVNAGWGKEQDEKLIELYNEGCSYRKISNVTGKGLSTVYTRVHKLIDDKVLAERGDKKCRKQ